MSSEWTKPPTPTLCKGSEPETADEFSMGALKQWTQGSEINPSIDSYYDFFHKAHPFAPTKAYMRSQIESEDISAITLYAAMSYVGCMYHQRSPERDLKSFALQQAHRAQQAQSISNPRNVYQVATLLLLAIVAYGRGELGEASGHLERAVSLSIGIGMNRVDWIADLDDRNFAELWKRTYWYLYIMAEALQDTDTNRDLGLECPAPDFPLPDTDDVFGPHASNQDSSQTTLSQLDLADFEDQAPVFSSLAYLINLVRTSRLVKKLVEQSRDRLDRTLVRADALLMNWKLHLPDEKQRVITKSGKVDDIMLQSHILFYSLRMLIHSSLPTRQGDGDELLRTRTKIEAAEAGIGLLTLYPCLLQMSPLNIKSLSRCAQTSLNTTPLIESSFSMRDNLRLVLGALKQVSTVWKTAELESQALRAMARKVYSSGAVPVQVVPTTTSTSPTSVLSKETDVQFADAIYLDQYEHEETSVDVASGSMSMSFFDTIPGSSDDASVFLWHF